MENEIIQTLSNDEVVRFIADRHNVDSVSLVIAFLSGDAKENLGLLDNEMAILNGLVKQLEQTCL